VSGLAVADTPAALDDRELAAQLILTGIDGSRVLSSAMKELFRDCPPGGILIFRYNIDADPERVKSFLAECVSFASARGSSGIVPFVAVDHEGGAVHRFGQVITRLPPAAFWRERVAERGEAAALTALEEAAYGSGTELRALGVTVNLAPVAEVLTGENHPFLGDRAFGSDPRFVEAAAAAFIRGMERAGVGCVAKHFPGNTGEDPHRTFQVLRGDAEELAGMIRPFASLISGGRLRAIMVSHALVPAVDGEHIASLSPVVMGKWLREELGFDGLIIADDFSMAAASSLNAEEAAAASLAAGADMIMAWPGNLRRVHRAIMAALEDGRLSRERLRESAARVLMFKSLLNPEDGP
jgi:beta-N-acetylhexosaminidase